MTHSNAIPICRRSARSAPASTIFWRVPSLRPDVDVIRVVDPGAGADDVGLRRLARDRASAALCGLSGAAARRNAGSVSARAGRRTCRSAFWALARSAAGSPPISRCLAFPVMAWSRTAKPAPQGVRGFHGAAGLDAMLGQTEVLVNLLPLTPETKGILNRRTFARMCRGGYLIQVGRGEHLVEADLLAALERRPACRRRARCVRGRTVGAAAPVLATSQHRRHAARCLRSQRGSDRGDVSRDRGSDTRRPAPAALHRPRTRLLSDANGYSSTGLVALRLIAAHPIDTLRAASAVPEALAQRTGGRALRPDRRRAPARQRARSELPAAFAERPRICPEDRQPRGRPRGNQFADGGAAPPRRRGPRPAGPAHLSGAERHDGA